MAIQTNVPVTLRAIGHATPACSIAIRSQVSGLLETVSFKEGEMVKAGQVLFSISGRPFSDALTRARSDLARDLGLQKQAAIEQGENAVLLQNRIVSKDSYNESAANADSLNAAVEADKAAVDLAEFELSNCQIRSPVDGRAGFLQVTPGNILTGPDMVLVTVNQTQPIFVDFPIPETDLPAIREAVHLGQLEVQAAGEGQGSSWTGILMSLDNAIDENTRTILLRARLPNKDEALWPGQSVNIRLRLGAMETAALVPAKAIQKGPEGEFVFVVRHDSTVEYRLVEPGEQVGDELMIRKGIEPGERIVAGTEHQLDRAQKVRAVNAGVRSHSEYADQRKE